MAKAEKEVRELVRIAKAPPHPLRRLPSPFGAAVAAYILYSAPAPRRDSK